MCFFQKAKESAGMGTGVYLIVLLIWAEFLDTKIRYSKWSFIPEQ